MTLVAPWRGDQGASKAIRPDRREENETMNKDEVETSAILGWWDREDCPPIPCRVLSTSILIKQHSRMGQV